MAEDWVGNKIARLRSQHKFTLKRLGTKVGCTGGHISGIERGRSAPSLSLIKKLASVFDVPWLWLLADLPPEACKVADAIAALSPDRRLAAVRLFHSAMEMAEAMSKWQAGSTK